MNNLKLVTISSTITLALIVLIVLIYLLTKNFKSKINSDGKLKISYGIWYATLFLTGTNIISNIVSAMLEAIDNIIKIQPLNLKMELIKTISLLLGVGFIWFLIWFFVVKFLTKIVPLKFNENEEMEDDNFGYFIIKGAILVGMIFSLSPILSLILRVIIPNVEIPFYH